MLHRIVSQEWPEGSLLFRLPAQHRTACGVRLVDAREPKRMGGRTYHLRIAQRLVVDLFHRVDESVECRAGLGLGWLDHQRAMHDQREIDRRRMDSEIQQALGDI